MATSDVAKHGKLPRLPASHTIRKRPLMRPPIPSPYTNAKQPKIVYVSARTPFISAVKRVRRLLALIERREIGKVRLIKDDGSYDSAQTKLNKIAKRDASPEPVYLRATGKAIERALNLVLYFQNREDCRVRLMTGTMGAVDDIVEASSAPSTGESESSARNIEDAKSDSIDNANQGLRGKVINDTLPESQVRKTSFLEAAVFLE